MFVPFSFSYHQELALVSFQCCEMYEWEVRKRLGGNLLIYATPICMGHF